MLDSPFSRSISPFRRVPGGGGAFDADAAAYIAAVETADGQTLEPAVKTAYDDFVRGCKADGIWDAIKASCIMAGARTLSGALVPLKGTTPTNFNFVSADYNRKTGLKGDGATKYLDSNRLDSAEPQNDISFSVSVSTVGSSESPYIATEVVGDRYSEIIKRADNRLIFRNRALTPEYEIASPAGSAIGFMGSSRSNISEFASRYDGSNTTTASASEQPSGVTWKVFRRSSASLFTNGRMSFYSIGESIDLAALDTRVSALMTALDGAIA